MRSLQGHRSRRRKAQRDLHQRALYPGRCRQGPLNSAGTRDQSNADVCALQGWQVVGQARCGWEHEGAGGTDQEHHRLSCVIRNWYAMPYLNVYNMCRNARRTAI